MHFDTLCIPIGLKLLCLLLHATRVMYDPEPGQTTYLPLTITLSTCLQLYFHYSSLFICYSNTPVYGHLFCVPFRLAYVPRSSRLFHIRRTTVPPQDERRFDIIASSDFLMRKRDSAVTPDVYTTQHLVHSPRLGCCVPHTSFLSATLRFLQCWAHP